MTDEILSCRRRHALAARAAGLTLHWVVDDQGRQLALLPAEGFRQWRPTEDAGDCLRLACALGFVIIPGDGQCPDDDYAEVSLSSDPEIYWKSERECVVGGDRVAAVMLAVFRAAVTMGERLERQGAAERFEAIIAKDQNES